MSFRQITRALIIVILLVQIAYVSRGAEVRSGSVDESFVPPVLGEDFSYLSMGWGKVIGMALGPNDEIYIGGHFTRFAATNGWKNWNGLARLQADGRVDENFHVPKYSDPTNHIDAHDIFVTDAGKVWVGFSSFHTRYSELGVLDRMTALGVTGVYKDGRVLANGARYSADLVLDNGFEPSSSGYDLSVLRNLKLLRIQRSGNPRGIARLNEDGTIDSTFKEVAFENGSPIAMAERGNGDLYVAGTFEKVNGAAWPRLVRLTEEGKVDESFRPDPRLTTGGTNAPRIIQMAVQANGKLLVVGDFAKSEPPLNGGIVRLNSNGSLDSTFDVGFGATEANDDPMAAPKISRLALQSDGRIVVAGDFQKFNGVSRDGVARLHGDLIAPLQILSITRVAADRAVLQISGTADVVDLEATTDLSSDWTSVASVAMTNEVSTSVEVSIESSGAKWYRVRRL
jgi:uncharacterized delta-60 repeat protein